MGILFRNITDAGIQYNLELGYTVCRKGWTHGVKLHDGYLVWDDTGERAHILYKDMCSNDWRLKK